MIQRIQTVFLLLAAIAFFLLFQFPFATSDIATSGFLADKDFDIYDNIVLIILTALGGILALIAIFLYKNRPLQVRLTYLSIIAGILLVVVAVVLFYNEASKILQKSKINDGVGLFLPVLAFILGFLAARFIKKDEKIVRSADRLR
ncbi:MAG TPA: DUF4293 family protein [Bacteroidetes bacterium]|nr:DUF4293 family protein [Bacteroidota bacterium]